MKSFIAITKLTALQVIKGRVFNLSLLLSVLLTIMVIAFSDISLDQNIRIIQNFGLAGTFLLAIIISIVSAANIVSSEQQKGNIYLIKPKPVSDLSYVAGKFFGLTLSLLVIYTVSFFILFITANFFFELNIPQIFIPFFFSFFEIAILIAVAILFSSFSTAIFSTLLTLAVFVVGHSLSLILSAATQTGGVAELVGKLIYYVMPNLEKFNLRETIYTLPQLSSSFYIWSAIYALFYICLCISLATLATKKREW